MPEPTKTLLFVGAALVSIALAIITRPSTGEYDPSDQLGLDIASPFPPEDAERLSIVKFDEETATNESFEVAKNDGAWTLPSKGGYPADANRQMAEAITGVTDREILQVVTDSADEHGDYGVIDPDSSKLQPGQTGVGVRVALSKQDGEKLVDMIIGKEVKDAEDQRYVRRADQDVVFVVEIDPEKFSTNFADWIEDDLLKLNSWDIRRVRINDYSSELFMTLQGLAADREYRTEITLSYDDGESKWNLDQLGVAPDGKRAEFTPVELGDDEELNEDKLGELKSALDDLKIVDVSSKPEGLSANLKAGEDFLNDQEALMSLVRRGFAPTQNAAGEMDLLSSEGEVICTMRDGVEYVLRFGNLDIDSNAAAEAGAAGAGDSADDSEDDDTDSKEGVNRYLFVMVRLNESAIDRPELEELPPLPEGVDPADLTEEGDEAESSAEESDEAASDDDSNDSEEGDDEAEPSELEKAVAIRRDVEQRNARLLDEYEDKLQQGRERVKELNARFGDWYYLVSNDVFTKVRLGRDDVIQKKEAEEGEAAAESGSPASEFGAPGAAVPGLPGLGAALDASKDESSNDEPSNDGASTDGVSTDEAMSETPADETSAAEPAAEEAAAEPAGEE